MLTEFDLRDALTAAGDAPTTSDLWPAVRGRLHRRRRRAVAAGVLLSALIVAVGVAIPLSGSWNQSARRPFPGALASTPLGPAITQVPAGTPASGVAGTTWRTPVSGGGTHLWALGTDCRTTQPPTCRLLLEESTDAGLTWLRRTPPPSPAGMSSLLVSLAASTSRIWAVYGINVLDQPLRVEEAGPDGSWHAVGGLGGTGYVTQGLAAIGGALTLVQSRSTGPATDCVAQLRILRITDQGSISQRLVTAATNGSDIALAGDGSVWVAGRENHPCKAIVNDKSPVYVQSAAPGKALGPTRIVPDDTTGPALVVVGDNTAYTGVLGPRLGTYSIKATHDGGRTWTDPIAGKLPFPDVYPSSSTGLVAVVTTVHHRAGTDVSDDTYSGAVSYSADGGVTRQPALSDPTGSLSWIASIGTGRLVALADDGRTVILSLDGGKTWHRQGRL